MAPSWNLLPLLLLQLCSLPLLLVARPTCSLQANLATETYHQLRDLGAGFPLHCLRYNANISFPDSAFNGPTASQCSRALWVVYETLRGTAQIFNDNDSPVQGGGVSWDEEKLDLFQNLQYRLLEDGRCLSRGAAPAIFSSYFNNVTDLIQQQDSAPCGWMALRRDVCRVLKVALREYHHCFI